MSDAELTSADLVRLLTPEQVADLLQMSRSWVYEQAARGGIPALRLGRVWRFRQSDVDAWLRARVSAGSVAQLAEVSRG